MNFDSSKKYSLKLSEERIHAGRTQIARIELINLTLSVVFGAQRHTERFISFQIDFRSSPVSPTESGESLSLVSAIAR